VPFPLLHAGSILHPCVGQGVPKISVRLSGTLLNVPFFLRSAASIGLISSSWASAFALHTLKLQGDRDWRGRASGVADHFKMLDVPRFPSCVVWFQTKGI
jgi:hypothetical protein